jgi:competence protein ComEC
VAGELLRTVPWRLRAAGVVCAVSAAALVLLPLGAPAAPGHLTVSFLDVGQGDATLIQHPDGTSVLFDGGRPEARVLRLVRQAGVRRLSLVVATHQSADHHGGLVELVQRLPVGTLLENGDGTRDPTFLGMVEGARAQGASIVRAEAGQVLSAGALTIRILWPPPRPPGPPPDDPNERAVIALVSSGGFDLLLSADAESPALREVDLPDVEAMKVPHHGSADPGLADQLERLRPEVAVIEVGEGNSYGHPDPGTLATLERAVPNVRRTDRDGTVRLEVTPGGLRLHP